MQEKKTGFNLYLIRHAESMENAGQLEETWPDMARHNSRLSEKGQEQARRLGQRFSGQAFDYIMASPLLRAAMTAEAILVCQPDKRPRQLEIMPELTECEFPVLEEAYGLATMGQVLAQGTELRMASGLVEDENIIHASLGAGHEGHFQRAERVAAYLQQRFTAGEEVAVVAHGAFNRYLIAWLLGFKTLQNLVIADNTSVTKLIFQPGQENGATEIVLASFNDSGHL